MSVHFPFAVNPTFRHIYIRERAYKQSFIVRDAIQNSASINHVAHRLVNDRAAHAPHNGPDDLQKVPGPGRARLQ